MLHKLILSLFVLLVTIMNLIADITKLQYSQNLTISDGLPHNGVTAILQDSKGYIWVGTYDGISRYDGYGFTIYKNTIDKILLTSNRVRSIMEDQKGNIWIGTDQGVTLYNYSKQIFTKLYSNLTSETQGAEPIIRRIIMSTDNHSILCATEGQGILVFNDNYTFSRQLLPGNDRSIKKPIFTDGIALDNSHYLFATSIGALLMDTESGQFKKILPEEITTCFSLSRINRNTFLATLNSGVAIFQLDPLNKLYAFKFKFKFKTLSSYFFYSSLVDKNGNLWLGTLSDGIIKITSAQSFSEQLPYQQSEFKPQKGLLRSSCLFESKTLEDCWFGTFNKGIYRFNLKENPFNRHDKMELSENPISSKEVMRFAPWDDHRVFLTASHGGFALLNTKTYRFDPLPFNAPIEELQKVTSLYVDSRKNIWAKFVGGKGLFRAKSGSQKIEKINFKEYPDLNTYQFNQIIEDKEGNLWIAANYNIFRLVLNNKNEIVRIESMDGNPFFQTNKKHLTRFLYPDPNKQFIWVGTDTEGLFRINLKKDKTLKNLIIDHYANDTQDKKSISSNFVTSIIRLPNNEFWIGTEGGGICKVINSETKPEFIPYTEKQGLSNNVVKNIICDDQSNLWISTNIGLNKFNTKKGLFQNFSKADGLPFEDFGYAAAKLSNGYFLFAGVSGFCYFKPSDLPEKIELPKLEFGELKIVNQTINAGDTINQRVLLTHRLNDTHTLTLKPNENIFSIEVKSLHFSDPKHNLLKYQLIPINKEWITIPSSQKNINYNGLPPGEYQLNVMASNALNQWTESKSLTIIIQTPFWKTKLAYLLYCIIILGIIYVVMFFILRIQSLNHNLEIEKLEKENVKNTNESKLRFFSNISHEIKTPITLITGPINQLSERFVNNQDVKEKLEMVQRQSKKILQLVNQVHDFQKADANLLKMNYSLFCFDSFVDELTIDFINLARSENKNFRIEKERSKIFVSADSDKMEKILNNVINNAFKFTKSSDTITLTYHRHDYELIVTISDTGKGIATDDLPYIFDRFYRSKRKSSLNYAGTGIGLAFTKRLVEMHYGEITAESELNKGTSILIRLPIIKEEPAENQEEKELEILAIEDNDNAVNWGTEKVDLSKIKIENDFSDALVYFAEDNPDMRKFVEEILVKFFKVKTFSNGQECLTAMEEEWPDIIISDVMMPELNGFELCKFVKSDIKTSHIPIILLTACNTTNDQIEGISIGADAYIAKPFNVQFLVTRTESLLRIRKQLRERFQIELPLTLEKNSSQNNDNIFLEKLYKLMTENLDNQHLDLNSFAKELYLNRTHFYQKVKALTNQTPFELMKMYRLKKAAEFLVQNKLSVNEVYLMTGFKSRTHFSSLFKEIYNVSPGNYANEMAKKNKQEQNNQNNK